MKYYRVTYTENMIVYKTEPIEGESYTDAYVNAMVKYPGAIITDLEEDRN